MPRTETVNAFRAASMAARHGRTELPEAERAEAERADAEAAEAMAARTAARMADRAAHEADVLAPDVAARIEAAAAALAGRLRSWGAESDDVAADVRADLLAAVADGGPVDLRPGPLAARVRRAADVYRRRADRERPAGTAADVVDGPEAAEAEAETDKRRRAAIMGRRPRSQSVDRADVLAVSDAARESMRPAEWNYLHAVDRSAVRMAEAADAWRPDVRRPAERAAWEAVDVRPMAAPYVSGRPMAARVAVAGRPMAERAERAALRSAERAARWAADDAGRRAAEAADGGDSEAADVAAVAAREARAAWLAARLACEAAAGRAERVAVGRAAVAEIRPVPDGGGRADALTAGYVAESLAVYRTAKRPRGALLTARHMTWAAVRPEATAAERAALGRAARGWAAHVSGAAAERWEADAWSAIVRREAADAEADRVWVARSTAWRWRAEAAEIADAEADAERRAAAREAARVAARESMAEAVAEAVAGRGGRGFSATAERAAARRAEAERAAWLASMAERPTAERPAPVSMLAAHVARMAEAVADAERAAAVAEAVAAR